MSDWLKCDGANTYPINLTRRPTLENKIIDLESRLEKQAEVIKELESKLSIAVDALGMIADDDGMSYMISGTHAYDIAKKALRMLK